MSEERAAATTVPEATVARLPLYLRSLVALAGEGSATVSSEQLASAAGVNASKVRKDLSYLGSYGTRGVGYEVDYLMFEMRRELGLATERAVLIAGAGNLGQALANYRGFTDRGFPVAGIIDADDTKVGKFVAGIEVFAPSEIPRLVDLHPGCIGVVATPAAAAQEVVDRFVDSGVTSVLNFAPAVVAVPDGVMLRQVDLALELQVLSFYAERTGEPAVALT